MHGQMTYYETRNGARVFAAGAFTIAGAALQPPVKRLLGNLWQRLGPEPQPPIRRRSARSVTTSGSTSRPVPILMYHVIARAPRSASFPDLYVPRHEFAAQMHWLARNGFQAVTLHDVFESWTAGQPLPPRPVVISFDDGYRSHVTAAYPLLRSLDWPGVLNLDVSNLTPSWGISPAAVRRLIAAGWEIDAHSLTHADVSRLSGRSLAQEIGGSRRAIRRLFGVPASFFCYPAGRFDDEAIAAVRNAGFLGATTTEHGLAYVSERFTLDRIRISPDDGAVGLARKLRGLGADAR
jgi:peptidoglycan/xylan/chitin deacetylase (PgdA/CDA1 family)